jgi:hypothetical protein
MLLVVSGGVVKGPLRSCGTDAVLAVRMGAGAGRVAARMRAGSNRDVQPGVGFCGLEDGSGPDGLGVVGPDDEAALGTAFSCKSEMLAQVLAGFV